MMAPPAGRGRRHELGNDGEAASEVHWGRRS
jgi:hypothetical protein